MDTNPAFRDERYKLENKNFNQFDVLTGVYILSLTVFSYLVQQYIPSYYFQTNSNLYRSEIKISLAGKYY